MLYISLKNTLLDIETSVRFVLQTPKAKLHEPYVILRI